MTPRAAACHLPSGGPRDIWGACIWVLEVSVIGVRELGPKRDLSQSSGAFVSGPPGKVWKAAMGLGQGWGLGWPLSESRLGKIISEYIL